MKKIVSMPCLQSSQNEVFFSQKKDTKNFKTTKMFFFLIFIVIQLKCYVNFIENFFPNYKIVIIIILIKTKAKTRKRNNNFET
jgi:hypothetical protein